MASNLQIFWVLLTGWIAIFAFGWQAYEFFMGKTIECDWDKCKYNKNGICRHKHVVMKGLTYKKVSQESPDFSHGKCQGLYCNNFSSAEIRRIDTKI